MQLDNSKSTFEMVSDQIESGIDPSASNYIVSSSYATGNLVRVGGPAAASTAVTTTEAVTTNSSFSGTTGTTSGTSGSTSSSGGGY